MTAMVFNTLQYAKQLKQAGFSEQQAEIQAEALQQVLENTVATRADLEVFRAEINSNFINLETKLNNKISAVEAKLDSKLAVKITFVETKMAELESEIIKWMVGLLTAQTAALISLMKFIH